jgi:hypothetical protein
VWHGIERLREARGRRIASGNSRFEVAGEEHLTPASAPVKLKESKMLGDVGEFLLI